MSEFFLSDNHARAFNDGTCPICKAKNINEMDEQFFFKNRHTVQYYAKCSKCLTDFTIYFKRKYITYFIKEKETCLPESESEITSLKTGTQKKKQEPKPIEKDTTDSSQEKSFQESFIMAEPPHLDPPQLRPRKK